MDASWPVKDRETTAAGAPKFRDRAVCERLRVPCCLAACALALLARMPDRFLNPQFYAEDAYFYERAMNCGVRSIGMPYGGYLLLIPRLVALPAVWLPPLYAPFFLNVAALVITLLVISRLLSTRTSLPMRFLLALCVVVLPHAEDLFMTFENIQWVASLALILMLISSDAASAGERAGDYATVVLVGLTGVFSILFLPFFLIRAILRRTLESGIIAGLVGVAALIQTWFVVHGGRPLEVNHPIPFDPGLVLPIFGYRLIVQLFGGGWWVQLPKFVLGFEGLLALAILAWLVRNPRLPALERHARWMLCAIVFPVVAASCYRFREMLPMLVSPEHLARYFFIPQMIFIWLVAAEIPTGGVRRVFSICALLAYFLTAICFFRVEPLIDYHWRTYAPLIRRGQRFEIPINPVGWYFRNF